MKFTCSVNINSPIDKVAIFFSDPGNLIKWQDGFVSYEHLSGTPRKEGAKSKITYKNGRRKIEVLETIHIMNLPYEKAALYEHKHSEYTISNKFTKLPGQKTKYASTVEYVRLGFLLKLIILFAPNRFWRQTQMLVEQFREVVEHDSNFC